MKSILTKRQKAIKYINRNNKKWFEQRQTKKLISTVGWLMFGGKTPK